MKKIFLTALIILSGLSMSAQNMAGTFAASLKGKCVSFSYSCSISADFIMNGIGKIKLQGDKFAMEGNGLDIRCDGTTRWINDLVSQECYIESVEKGAIDYELNPALLITSVDKAFKATGTSSSEFNGKKVTEIRLSPLEKNGSIKEVSLYMADGNTPAGVKVSTASDTVMTVSISDFKTGEALPEDTFRLDTSKLGKEFLITDLR